MSQDEPKKSFDMQKIVMISIMAGLGTLLLGAMIAFFIHVSQTMVFKDANFKIKISYPKTWKALPNYGGTIVDIVAPEDNSLDSFRENINISVVDLPPEITSLSKFTQLARIQTENLLGNTAEIIVSEEFVFKGLQAYRYSIRNKQVPEIEINFIWYFKDNTAFVITSTNEVLFHDKYKRIFDSMLKSYSIDGK
jgi:hypothetical protein